MTFFLKKFKFWAVALMVLFFFAAAPLSSCSSQGQESETSETEEHPEGEDHPESEEEEEHPEGEEHPEEEGQE